MIEILLSIGAINALIPIIVILILIAAAAGSSRGSKLFELFGISTLLGINVGRGTLARKSPFKTKRFSSGKNPFQRAVTGTHNLLKGPFKNKVLNPLAQAKFGNNSFNNLEKNVKAGLAGAAATGVTAHDWHKNNAKSVMSGIQKNNIKAGSFATTLESQIRSSEKNNVGKTNSYFAKKLSGLHNDLKNNKITQNEFDSRRAQMKHEYSQQINVAHATTQKEVETLIKNNKPASYAPPATLSPKELSQVWKYQSLEKQKRDVLVEVTGNANKLSAAKAASEAKEKLTAQLKKGTLTKEEFKAQMEDYKPHLETNVKKVNKDLTNANERLSEIYDRIRKLEDKNKTIKTLTDEFKNIRSTTSESVQRTLANNYVGTPTFEKMNIREYTKKHGA